MVHLFWPIPIPDPCACCHSCSMYLSVHLVETAFYESVFMVIPSLSPSALSRLLQVCLVEICLLLLMPGNVTCLCEDNTTGLFIVIYCSFQGMHIKIPLYKYVQLYIQKYGQMVWCNYQSVYTIGYMMWLLLICYTMVLLWLKNTFHTFG